MTKPAALKLATPRVGAASSPGRIVVTVSWPSPDWMKALTPHAQGHWRSKADPVKWLRREACAVCRSVWPWPAMEQARVVYRFHFPRNGTYDEINMAQRMKPVVDGIKDAGVIVDDNWSVLSTGAVESCKDSAYPRIEIVMEER